MKGHPKHIENAWGEWEKYAKEQTRSNLGSEVDGNAETSAGGSGTPKGKGKEAATGQTDLLEWEDNHPYIPELNADDMPNLKMMKTLIKSYVQHHYGEKFYFPTIDNILNVIGSCHHQ